jgi:hypothetical protein
VGEDGAPEKMVSTSLPGVPEALVKLPGTFNQLGPERYRQPLMDGGV